MAEHKENFPDPTGPTTPTKLPVLILRLISSRVAASSQLNVPFLIMIALSSELILIKKLLAVEIRYLFSPQTEVRLCS